MVGAVWREEMASHLVFSLPATIALFLVTLTALRRISSAAAAIELLRGPDRIDLPLINQLTRRQWPVFVGPTRH